MALYMSEFHQELLISEAKVPGGGGGGLRLEWYPLDFQVLFFMMRML